MPGGDAAARGCPDYENTGFRQHGHGLASEVDRSGDEQDPESSQPLGSRSESPMDHRARFDGLAGRAADAPGEVTAAAGGAGRAEAAHPRLAVPDATEACRNADELAPQ